MALLARSPDRSVNRQRLVSLLWPEAPPARGRHLLSESLYVLRRSLGASSVVAEGDRIRLDLEHLEVDVIRFEDLIGRR